MRWHGTQGNKRVAEPPIGQGTGAWQVGPSAGPADASSIVAGTAHTVWRGTGRWRAAAAGALQYHGANEMGGLRLLSGWPVCGRAAQRRAPSPACSADECSLAMHHSGRLCKEGGRWAEQSPGWPRSHEVQQGVCGRCRLPRQQPALCYGAGHRRGRCSWHGKHAKLPATAQADTCTHQCWCGRRQSGSPGCRRRS